AVSCRDMRRLALLVLSFAPACRPAHDERPELVVYAAASLRDVLQELAPAAEAGSDARLVFNFGSSGDLARQILAADAADLFFSADEREMERVASAGRIEPATRRALLANELVVIEPADERPSLFRTPFEPAQLADLPQVSLADPESVPAGRYARAWLEARGAWAAVAPKVVPAVDVRAALAAVESGALRAGIVYRTDAARSTRVRVVFAVPSTEGPEIRYPLAVLKGRPEAGRARELALYLASEEALAVFARHGFVPLRRAD
ncbi:MAG TPA: molybdate ABC transporter substrate-binding protein, partial [Planctomycetota bacterium]|nr:molybdate ABC transporter substrate-binding protein [Planctomycetota bacterium]